MNQNIEALERLERLRNEGGLTDAEFEAAKDRILSSSVRQPRRGRFTDSRAQINPLLVASIGLGLVAAAIAGGLFLTSTSKGEADTAKAASASLGPPPKVAAPAQTAPVPTGASESGQAVARLRWCNMGSCSWSKELSRDVVEQIGDSVLYRLHLLGGESDMDETDSEADFQKVKWNAEPHDTMVFCSKRYPAVFLPGNGIYILPLNPDHSFPNVLTSDFSIYRDVCGPNSSSPDTSDEFARAFGYAITEEMAEAYGAHITTQEDLIAAERAG